ncbi:hypothetical protein ACFL6N_05850 [Thermodesulfobacteriota bacterium]
MKKKKPGRPKYTLRKKPLLLFMLFLIPFLVGIGLNEPARVLELAVTICLSCMGIG